VTDRHVVMAISTVLCVCVVVEMLCDRQTDRHVVMAISTVLCVCV